MRSVGVMAVVLSASYAFVSSAAIAQGAMVRGEVKKIDGEAGKITLKHGPIKNLDMDGMTMVLRVKEPSMLAKLKVGDKVRFEAERAAEGVTIAKMQKAK